MKDMSEIKTIYRSSFDSGRLTTILATCGAMGVKSDPRANVEIATGVDG
jgi:hypothetical protein